MNKAFVREPDDTGQRFCPRCQSLGEAVPSETIAALLSDELRAGLADAAYFCPFARCEVVYFDSYERVITTAQFSRPVWPKDAEAPLCPCFGFTREAIEEDLADGGVVRIRELVEKAKSPAAECLTKSPTGHSCVTEIQRYYFKLKGGV
jgi:hypothetical protein